MGARVELGIAIPQTFLHDAAPGSKIRTFLRRAEALGFESAWVLEQIVGSIPSLEPVALLTYAAAVTERMRLGSAVLLTAIRSPVHLAKTLGTLDHLSEGRLTVGVGLGADSKLYPAYGIPAERRAARFVEGIRLMKRLWTEPRISFEGEFWRLENASMEPKPLQKPHPPIFFGGHHPNALKRAVELGEGFIGRGGAGTAQFMSEVQTLRKLLAESARDPATFAVGKRVYIAVDRDRRRAKRRLADWFDAFYGRAELAEVCGDVEECIHRLAEIVQGGAKFLILNPVFDELEHLEQFASKIVSKL